MGWSWPGGSRLGGRCIGRWVADPRAVEAARAQRTPVSLNVAGTTEQIQRGQAISDGFCSDCHSTTGRLTGGLDIGGHFPLPIGSFVSSNLTPAGPLSRSADRTAMIMISSPQAGLFRSRSLPMGGEGWIWDFHREGVLLSLTTSSKAIECTGDP
jgi:hypothetical protein